MVDLKDCPCVFGNHACVDEFEGVGIHSGEDGVECFRVGVSKLSSSRDQRSSGLRVELPSASVVVG